MKKIKLFTIECTSEEEEYIYYFDGEGTEEDFQKDVKNCVLKILNKDYAFVKVDEQTFIRKRALNNKNIEKFLHWLRNDFGYNGKVWIDILKNNYVSFITDNPKTNLEIYRAEEQCPVKFVLDNFLLSVRPSKVIDSGEFKECMKKKGWEEVEIEPKGYISFYEWGGFVQDVKGKWYNHIWNEGLEEIKIEEEQTIAEEYYGVETVSDDEIEFYEKQLSQME